MQTRSSYLQIIPLILNHFWPNLVHLYKMYFWTSLVLCVVFKCQYFWSYSRKTHFWPFIYLFLYTQNLFDWSDFFFYWFRTFQLSFLFFKFYHFQRIMKNVKNLNFVAAILDFWRPSWIDNGDFLTLYSIHDNDHLY